MTYSIVQYETQEESYKLYEKRSMMGTLVQISFRTISVGTVLLPLFAFITCVVWSLTYNFNESTSTHCHVPNFLPSISAAIGGYTPQIYIWRIAIAVHSAPRYLVSSMYYKHLCNTLSRDNVWQCSAFFAFVLQFMEVTCLVGLTYISSTDNFPVHEKFFVMFVLSSLLNMFILCVVPKYGYKQRLSRTDVKSLRYKTICAIVNVVSFSMAVYFYFRHNWYCEPYIYTLFAFCEYVVVLSNMSFHMTAYWDFSDQKLTVCSI